MLQQLKWINPLGPVPRLLARRPFKLLPDGYFFRRGNGHTPQWPELFYNAKSVAANLRAPSFVTWHQFFTLVTNTIMIACRRFFWLCIHAWFVDFATNIFCTISLPRLLIGMELQFDDFFYSNNKTILRKFISFRWNIKILLQKKYAIE